MSTRLRDAKREESTIRGSFRGVTGDLCFTILSPSTITYTSWTNYEIYRSLVSRNVGTVLVPSEENGCAVEETEEGWERRQLESQKGGSQNRSELLQVGQLPESAHHAEHMRLGKLSWHLVL